MAAQSRPTRVTLLLGLCAWLTAGLVACVDGPTAVGAGEITVQVAPLTLSGVTDARYTLRVTNAPGGGGDEVWSRTVDSSRFGDGAGSLSYVGPCDADAGINSVTVTLDRLYEGSGTLIDPATYRNPTPITRDVVCEAGADTRVVFDMTIARDARQGFFDVAVSFGDVFCSAKLDCVRSGTNEDLDLLHNPGASGQRDMTAVMAFACTASPSGETYLYLDDPQIVCAGLGGQNVSVDVAALGNVDLSAAPSANPGGYLFAAAVSRGDEELASKSYWNVSFGLDNSTFASAGPCTLHGRATASSSPWSEGVEGFSLPTGSIYPVIEWSVPLSNATARVCTTHQVSGPDGTVTVQYQGYQGAANQFSWSPAPIEFRCRYQHGSGQVICAQGCDPNTETFVDGECLLIDGQACTDDAECDNDCVNGTCTYPPGPPCTSPAVCAQGEVCVGRAGAGEDKIVASDAHSLDFFGSSVSLSGDTAVVGAYNNDDKGGNSGSAYVFVRAGSGWTQQALLISSDTTNGDYLGYSVSVSGDTAVVGAYGDDDQGPESGSAYIFQRSAGGAWSKQAKLTVNTSVSKRLGHAVFISGDTALVGAYLDSRKGSGSGSTYVFQRSGTSWTRAATLTASDGTANDHFGDALSLSGDTALVGAMDDDEHGQSSGAAYVFVRSGSTWTQQAKLVPSDGASKDYFGCAVSVSGDTALIGAYEDDDAGTNSGAAYVFVRVGGTWSQQAKLVGAHASESFGWSVALAGDLAVIGAYRDSYHGNNAGAAYVFARAAGTWDLQAKFFPSDSTSAMLFGRSVSLSDDVALVGAYQDSAEADRAGSAYLFDSVSKLGTCALDDGEACTHSAQCLHQCIASSCGTP